MADTPETTATPTISAIIAVSEEIKQSIANSTDDIKKRFISEKVAAEVERRKNVLVKIWDKLQNLRKEANKLKPDQPFFDDSGSGKPVVSYFSKPQAEALKKNKEELAKYTAAWEDALKGNFEKAFKLGDGKDNKPSNDSEESTE